MFCKVVFVGIACGGCLTKHENDDLPFLVLTCYRIIRVVMSILPAKRDK